MNIKDLEKLGLTAEAIEKAGLPENFTDQVMALYGKSVTKLRGELETATTKHDAIKEQLDAANTQIADFQKMDIEGIKTKAQEWEQKAKQAQIDSEAKVAALQLKYAVENELKNSFRVIDPQDVLHRLDMTTIKLNADGAIIGLREQVEPMTEKYAHLFTPADSTETEAEVDSKTTKPTLVKSTTKQTQPASPDAPVSIGEAIRARLGGAAK